MKKTSENRASFSKLLVNGVAVSAMSVLLAGCSSGPARVDAPDYDPSGSAARAMELHDADKDGFIAAEELEKAVGLKAAIKTLDKDQDGKVSEAEIAERIKAWQATGAGLTTIRGQVTLDGKPLVEAKVTFEPEEFLTGIIQSAEATTNREGAFSPRIPKEKRPSADSPGGIQLGIYKVRITKSENGAEIVPAKFNTQTILGQQVAPDDPGVASQLVRFNLVTPN